MKFLANFGLSIIASAAKIWAVIMLWGWFIAPKFSIAPLRIPEAAGILILITFTTFDPSIKRDEGDDASAKRDLLSICVSLFSLLFGFLWSLFL